MDLRMVPVDAYSSLTKKEFRLSLRDSLVTREPAFIVERRKQIKLANLSLGIQTLLYCLFIPAVHSNLNSIVCDFK
jgi:phosphoribosyl-dephospho-CoA transferase